MSKNREKCQESVNKLAKTSKNRQKCEETTEKTLITSKLSKCPKVAKYEQKCWKTNKIPTKMSKN